MLKKKLNLFITITAILLLLVTSCDISSSDSGSDSRTTGVDGVITTTSEDGTITETATDGTVTVTQTDGTVTVTTKDGTTITTTPDGEVSASDSVDEESDNSLFYKIMNFTESGKESDFYTISGNLSTSKGTVTYSGLSLSKCLKIESSTSISFTAVTDGTLVLVFNDGETGSIKIDGTSNDITNGVLTIALSAGAHTITKGDSMNLYYISLSTTADSSTSTDGEDTSDDNTAEDYDPSQVDTSPAEVIDGDITLSPGDDIQNAIDSIAAGNTIWLTNGSYDMKQITILIDEDNCGTSSAYKYISAVSGAKPVLDWNWTADDDSTARGVVLDGAYWHITGVTFREAGDNGMLLSGDNNIIEDCIFTANRDTGLQISRYNTNYKQISQWPSNNLILRCESFDNADQDCEDADGFAAKLTVGEGNIFDSCVSHHNIDDGWDLYTKSATGVIGVVKFYDCIAHSNGNLTDGSSSGSGDMNGYKLGSSSNRVNHELYRCVAFNNGKHGFTDNGNVGSIKFINLTSYNNGDYNYHTRDNATHIFRNCISFDGNHTDRIVGDAPVSCNAFDDTDTDWTLTASSSDFESLTPGDNSDPTANGFLNLSSSSQFIDLGVEYDGIEYNGSAPDLGAIES